MFPITVNLRILDFWYYLKTVFIDSILETTLKFQGANKKSTEIVTTS